MIDAASAAASAGIFRTLRIVILEMFFGGALSTPRSLPYLQFRGGLRCAYPPTVFAGALPHTPTVLNRRKEVTEGNHGFPLFVYRPQGGSRSGVGAKVEAFAPQPSGL